ncbi:MAG TPA: hypothetical protein VF607_07195 [Verrucomicrobiae bacterium]
MNVAKLQAKLTAAARLQKPDDRVPYAFEKRITALLAQRKAPSLQMLWARGLWRAALACIAVAVVAGTVAFLVPKQHDPSNDLSQEFENTLLASADLDDASTP